MPAAPTEIAESAMIEVADTTPWTIEQVMEKPSG